MCAVIAQVSGQPGSAHGLVPPKKPALMQDSTNVVMPNMAVPTRDRVCDTGCAPRWFCRALAYPVNRPDIW
jgi:hypothetical protein